MSAMIWSADEADHKVQELLEEVEELRTLLRGADSDIVYAKLNTVETALELLRAYIREAESQEP